MSNLLTRPLQSLVCFLSRMPLKRHAPAIGYPLYTARFALVVCVATALAACTSTPSQNLYYWGDYEQLIYDWYHKPGSAVPSEQIYRLNEVIQRAEEQGKAVAPGVFAQLGMMYAMVGNPAAAEQAFQEEKTRFPEAAVFVDGMLQRSRQMRGEQRL